MAPDLLDEKVVYKNGVHERVHKWWRGIHPRKGVIVQGLTGWETFQETDRIRPMWTFRVNRPQPVHETSAEGPK